MTRGADARDRSREHRILSIDGGGSRAVVALEALREIEGILPRDQNGDRQPLCVYFDYVVGAGSGAILAAGIAYGFMIDEIDDAVFTKFRGRDSRRRDSLRIPARLIDWFDDIEFGDLVRQVEVDNERQHDLRENDDLVEPVSVNDAQCHFAVPVVNYDRQEVQLLATHRATPVLRRERVRRILKAAVAAGPALNRVPLRVERPDTEGGRDPIGRRNHRVSRFGSVENTGYVNPAASIVRMVRKPRPVGCGWADKRLLVVSLGNGRERHHDKKATSRRNSSRRIAEISAVSAADDAHVYLNQIGDDVTGIATRWAHDTWSHHDPGMGHDRSSDRLRYMRLDATLDTTTLYRHRLIRVDSQTSVSLNRKLVRKELRNVGRQLGRDIDRKVFESPQGDQT